MTSRPTNANQSTFNTRRVGRVDFIVSLYVGPDRGNVDGRVYLADVPKLGDDLIADVVLFSAGDLEVVDCRRLVAR